MSEASLSVGRHGGTAFDIRGEGRPLVFIHGVGLNRAVWEPQVAAFAPAFRVVTYDTLGHGDSALPPEGAEIGHYVDQLGELLDALDLARPLLVGHSMGGMIATAFAAARPERVAGLAVLNAVHRRSVTERAGALLRADALEAGGPAATTESALARWFGPGPDLATDLRATRLRAWLMGADPVGYARAYRVFAQSDGIVADGVQAITAPALFATGELDPNSTPAMAEAMAAAAARGRAAILPGERHMMPFVNPASTNALLADFAASVFGPR